MAVSRKVGYSVGVASIRGTALNLATIGSGFTVTRFKCQGKLIFAQATNFATYVATGVWGAALQSAPTPGPPTAWNASGSDASIMAFANAEPDGLERVFWAPGNASAQLVATFQATVEWRGQMLLTTGTDFFFVPVDVTNAASTFKLSVAWQLWYG